MGYEPVPAAPGGGGGGGGVTDHGALTGLGDNDHPQYAQLTGGLLTIGSATGTSRQLVLTGAGVSVDDSVANVRTATISGGASGPTAANAAPPAIVSVSGSVGTTTTEFALEDHTHAHGSLAGGALHAAATTALNGFMLAADKLKLDGYPAYPYQATQTVGTAQQDLTFSGLNGDSDGVYEIIGYGPSDLGSITFKFNSTAASGYSTLFLGGSIATTYLGYMGQVYSAFRILAFCRSGSRRSAFCMSHQNSGAADMYLGNTWWSDTSANITQLVATGSVAGQFKTGFRALIRAVVL